MTCNEATRLFLCLFLLGCGGPSTGGDDSMETSDAGPEIETERDAGRREVERPPDVTGPDGETEITWVRVEPGTFTMGSPESEPCRTVTKEIPHQVTLTRPFELAATETTQAQYVAVVGENPSHDQECGEGCPVENLTWHMAAAFCNALSPTAGLQSCYECTGSGVDTVCHPVADFADGTIQSCGGYRLPTEAEWEYAYRAGTDSALYNGGVDAELCSGSDPNAMEIGWFSRNSDNDIHPVAQLEPNAWGIYDMAGNTQEWVEDYYVANLTTDEATDPVIIEEGRWGIIRGGSFAHGPERMRGAFRVQNTRANQGTSLSVRCARTLDEGPI